MKATTRAAGAAPAGGDSSQASDLDERTEPALPAGRVPDFFIIGHEKSGTTALYRILQEHPQIFMPAMKEPRFFLREEGAGPARPGKLRPRTFAEYLALFAEAEPQQRAGEASPQYIRSGPAAERIAAAQPEARIVAILREPASFLRTYHLQNLGEAIETEKDLRRAIELEPARREGEQIPSSCEAPDRLLYSSHVRYAEQLRRYRSLFGADRVLTLIYDDFRRDNDATVRQVLRFLDVDDTVALASVEVEGSRRKQVRFMPLHHATRAIRRARHNPDAALPLARAINALTPKPLRGHTFEYLWRRLIYAKPQPADPQLMLELRRRFKPEVLALSDLLERDLVTLWGYDRIS